MVFLLSHELKFRRRVMLLLASRSAKFREQTWICFSEFSGVFPEKILLVFWNPPFDEYEIVALLPPLDFEGEGEECVGLRRVDNQFRSDPRSRWRESVEPCVST